MVPDLELHATPANQTIYLDWSVNITLPITTTWTITYTGLGGEPPSPITGTVSDTRSFTLTELTNYTWYTITLSAMLDDTIVLSDTVTAMPTDHILYLPIIDR
jgi:hypothetical protein